MHEKHTSFEKHSFSKGELLALEESLAQSNPTSAIPYDQFKKEMFEFIATGKRKYQNPVQGDKKHKL